MIDLAPDRLDVFLQRLEAHPAARIEWDAIWGAFHDAFPGRPTGPEGRLWLLTALQHAQAHGIIAFPSNRGNRWDRAVRPHLPRSVDKVVEDQPVLDARWRRDPWHPMLAWVADLPSVSTGTLTFLRRVQAGLVRGEFATPAPLKYRSLALTGNEKRLGKLITTKLFGNGRLSLELLGCLPESLPLAWAPVGPSARAIVFENAEPFTIAHRLLLGRADAPYGVVAYGGGNAVAKSIAWLTTIGRRVEAVHYVGDLDRPGLDFANAAARAAEAAGLPPLIAAPGVHAAMLRAAATFGFPSGWIYAEGDAPTGDSERLAFLPMDIRPDVAKVLEGGRRIPEEVLGPAELSTVWFPAAVQLERH
jgi:hypothetical protein